MMPGSIVTVDCEHESVLKMRTEDIREDEFLLAREIADQLFQALQPYTPAAGLAAPQIGISRSIFIFSYDRDPKNLEVVINPTFIPLEETRLEGWEACLSVLLSNGVWECAKLARYEKIKAIYYNLEGEKVEKVLEGFAAKAFQHEYDHLQGIVNIYRSDAATKSFDSKEELVAYMKDVKKQDAAHYKKPN